MIDIYVKNVKFKLLAFFNQMRLDNLIFIYLIIYISLYVNWYVLLVFMCKFLCNFAFQAQCMALRVIVNKKGIIIASFWSIAFIAFLIFFIGSFSSSASSGLSGSGVWICNFSSGPQFSYNKDWAQCDFPRLRGVFHLRSIFRCRNYTLSWHVGKLWHSA